MITAIAPKKQCLNHSSRLIALVFAFPCQAFSKSSDFEFTACSSLAANESGATPPSGGSGMVGSLEADGVDGSCSTAQHSLVMVANKLAGDYGVLAKSLPCQIPRRPVAVGQA
jgi:hypothetical protein